MVQELCFCENCHIFISFTGLLSKTVTQDATYFKALTQMQRFFLYDCTTLNGAH